MTCLPLREQARLMANSTFGMPRTKREFDLNAHRQMLAYCDAFSILHESDCPMIVPWWQWADGQDESAYTLGMGLGPYGV